MAESIEPVVPQEVDLDQQLKLAQTSIAAATKSIESQKKAMSEGRLSTPKLSAPPAPSITSRKSRPISNSTGEETDHTGVVEPTLPDLPPSIRSIASPKMASKLKDILASGISPQAPDERDKIIAIAKSFNANPKFAQKVLDKLGSGGFNETQQRRVKIATNILDAARKTYGGESGGLDPGALTSFVDQAMLQENNVGANKEVRVDLNRNLKTGRLVIDVPNTLMKSMDSHIKRLLRDRGVTYLRQLPEEEQAEVRQEAQDLASSDVIGVAMSARNLAMFDPGNINVKELSKERFRGIKAHFSRRTSHGGIYEAFSPTVDDLASEGPLDYFLRAQSPLDWMAPKMKLIREKLDAAGAKDKYGNLAALYATAAFVPIANDWAMDQLGVTAEEEVRAYVEGWTWAEEGKVKQATLSALVAEATGGDPESVRKRSMQSAGSLALPLAAYLFEPDVIFFTTFGIGKGLSAAKAAKAAKPVVAAADLLRKTAKSSDVGLAQAIDELRKIDPVMADHAKVVLTAKAGRPVGDIDAATAQLSKRQEEAKAAEDLLRETLAAKDIDDLVDIARLSRENPEIAGQIADVVEKRARVAGKAQSIRAGMSEQLIEMDKAIESQRKAKKTAEQTEKALAKKAGELLKSMNGSEPLRNFVNAENVLLRHKGQLKAAISAGDQGKIVELSDKVAKNTKEVNRLRKQLSKPEKAQVLTFRKEVKPLSKANRTAREAYRGDDALKALEAQSKKIRTTSLRFNPIVAKAQDDLTRATRRMIAADPRAARSFAKRLKEIGVTGDVAKTVRESQKLVRDFTRKEKALSDSLRANRWRSHALELADDYAAAAKEIRRVGGQRGLLFSKTGPLGARTEDAMEIFSDAVRLDEAPEFSVDIAARGITETTEKGGRSVRIADSVEGITSDAEIIARVSDETPDLLTVEKVAESVDDPIKSQATIGNIQSMLHYAQRNGLGLDMAAKEANEVASLLRAAGLNVDSAGKIGADALRGVDLGPLNARVGQLGPGVILDGSGLYEKMVSGFGEAATKFTLTKGGEAGKLVARSIDAGVPIRITVSQAEKIQFELSSILAKSHAVLDPARKHEKLAAIILDARSHHPTFKRTWLGSLGNFVKDHLRSYDAWFQRLGTASEDVAKIVRGGENLTEVAWEEYQLVLKEAGRGTDAVRQATYRYLDTTSRMLLPGGRASVFNMGTKTIFQRAKRALLSDTPRHKYKAMKSEEAMAQINNPALLGLARVWLPGGVNVTEAAAKKLYGDALKNLSKASTAEEFLKLQRASTIKRLREGAVPSVDDVNTFISKSVDGRIGRVHAFATRSFVTGAAYDEVATIAKRAAMGTMTAEEAADMNRLLTGDYSNITDIDKTFDRMYAMGISFLDRTTDIGQSGISAMGQVNKAHKEIIKFADEATGEGIFAVNIARRSLDQAMGKYIKSLEATEAALKDPATKLASKAFRKIMELWRTAAVTGLIIPNLGRPVFDFYGDWTQMVFTNGLGFANRALFQNVWGSIPKYGPAIQDRLSRLSKSTKQPQLRSVVETLFNPHIEDFWQGKQGALRMGKNGPLVSYDFIRRRSIVDGIWDNQVTTDVLNLAQKLVQEDPTFRKLTKSGTTLDYIFDFGKNWQGAINRWVQTMQQRQRVGTYLIHLNDGKSFDEAARLTRNAIYDWKHGISQSEILYMARAFPFVRWARLTNAQLIRGALEGMTKPDLNKFAKAAVGQTAIGRLRSMYRIQRELVPYMMDSRSPEEIAAEEGYTNAVARALYPNWMKRGMYPLLGIKNVDRGDIERNATLFGDEGKYTHWALAGAPNGLIDIANLQVNALSMVAATYLKMRGEDLAAADLFTKGTAGFTGMMYPTFRDITEQLAGIRQQRGSGFGQPTPINPTEAAILRNMGVETSFNKERNQFYTTTTSAKILTMLPLVALNFTRVANDWKYRNPAAGEDLAEQMKWFALSQTRLVRAYPYNVYKEHERLQKIMSERAKIIEKKFEFDK